MDSSRSPPFQLQIPKIEPKIEPEFPSKPRLRDAFLSPIQTPLQNLTPNLDAERRRVHQFIRATAKNHSSAAAASTSLAVADLANAGKKRKSRSNELHRVGQIDYYNELIARDLVRQTLTLYESLRNHLLLQEVKTAGKRGRADLTAATIMADSGLWLYRDRRTVGFIPGVYIGDVFFYRMELCVIGLHGQVQAGIDYATARDSPTGEPIATSIIVSGGYEDDIDGGNVLVYTGHGGREGRNEVKHSGDQKLEGGNLALERSCHYNIEIRVIRGSKSDRSPTGRAYVYDGLYRVVKCWTETGKSGFDVCKYELVRIEGQEEMGSRVLKLAEDLKANPMGVRPKGYLSLDISKGKEKLPVAVFNDIDDDREPLNFDYLVHPVFPVSIVQGPGCWGGCECELDCSVDCCCLDRNGGDWAYDGNGILSKGKPLVYECGKFCRCMSTCHNRVSQRGLRHRLEVFRSRETGWGVRSLDLVRAGEFICEFSGFVLTASQSDIASRNGASLVYPNQFRRRWTDWGDLSRVIPGYRPPEFPALPELSFSIDVSILRNVACYLSHSCSPNVFVQYVLFDHYNVQYPHLMIFAKENIPPMRELSLDYGIDICGEVTGSSPGRDPGWMPDFCLKRKSWVRSLGV